MTATAIATREEQRIARPLKVLVPLIQEDIRHAKDAADEAARPYYLAAGEKLLEAKEQIAHGEFKDWIKRNFPSVTYETTRTWMRFAEAVGSQKAGTPVFSTISEVLRQDRPNYNVRIVPPEYHEPVQRIVNRVDTETLNLKREELKRADERDAQRQLALQLIDIGYKVLARTLHPDKGGSREAMARLNAVRDRLKAAV